jgi:putative flippase GtrA
MTLQTLVIRYAAFAVIATVANLATQRAVLQLGNTGAYFAAAVGAGTIIGLVIKYLLDKRWIFHDIETGMRKHSQMFSLYTVMGTATTAIFWGTETAFWMIWHTDFMRELGAMIGLSIGYIIKYNLDRRFVFADRQMEVTT